MPAAIPKCMKRHPAGFLRREVGADVEILHFARDWLASRLGSNRLMRAMPDFRKHVRPGFGNAVADGEMILIR